MLCRISINSPATSTLFLFEPTAQKLTAHIRFENNDQLKTFIIYQEVRAHSTDRDLRQKRFNSCFRVRAFEKNRFRFHSVYKTFVG